MRMLADYCFVEAHPSTGSYSMHVCVHDWTLDGLNREIDASLYWLAFDSVACCIDRKDWNTLSSLKYHRVAAHAIRLEHDRFRSAANQQDEMQNRLTKVVYVGQLLLEQTHYQPASNMYQRALTGYEKALGPDHTSTLNTVNNLGLLYMDQGKMVEAGQMYQRALTGIE